MIYVVIATIFFLLAVYEIFHTDRVSKILLYLAMAGFVCLVGGLRHEVGADWSAYEHFYNEPDAEDVVLEPLFAFMIFLFNKAGVGFNIFVLFIFTLSFSFKFASYYKYSPILFISLLLYLPIQFMVYDLNGVRQGLAIAFTTFSIRYVLKRELIPFLIIMTIAFTIHSASIVFLPFYWIANRNFSVKLICFTLLCSIAAGLILGNILRGYLLSLDGVQGLIVGKLLGYASSDDYGKQVSLISFSTVQKLMVFTLFIIFRRKMNIDEKLYLLLRNGYFISLIMFFALSAIELFATRGSMYYRCLDIIMIACLVNIPSSKYLKLLFAGLVFLYCLMQIATNLSMPDNSLVPYKTFIGI